jgi:hypothetical protein
MSALHLRDVFLAESVTPRLGAVVAIASLVAMWMLCCARSAPLMSCTRTVQTLASTCHSVSLS